ncbi:MAG: hypothetical protein KAS25_03575 [Dehalococcoidales bacterium]|nr:hypothetical protein [Dehalococcoidales bacterium]
MKRRMLFISLALVLVLTMLIPGTALAVKPQPFYAAGVITGIEDTVIGDNAFPAGESGRWRVVGRDITGQLSGDVSGSFVMTYKANVELATQAGNLQGNLVMDDASFKVNGKIQPLEIVPTPLGIDLPKLTITGHWNLDGKGPGNGDFEAWVIFVPDEYGHVVMIIASSFIMEGNW